LAVQPKGRSVAVDAIVLVVGCAGATGRPGAHAEKGV
jgi:hypothetical protein